MWIWVVSNIAGSLLGAASATWIKDTKLGVWGYSKFEDIANWAQERYGIDILDKEDINICHKNKYEYVMPENLDKEVTLQDVKIDELEDDKLLRLWHGNDYSKSARL